MSLCLFLYWQVVDLILESSPLFIKSYQPLVCITGPGFAIWLMGKGAVIWWNVSLSAGEPMKEKSVCAGWQRFWEKGGLRGTLNSGATRHLLKGTRGHVTIFWAWHWREIKGVGTFLFFFLYPINRGKHCSVTFCTHCCIWCVTASISRST